MDHIRLQPLQGQSGREPTAVTNKSIKELLAEEGVEVSDAPIMPTSKPEPEVELNTDVRVFDHRRLQPLQRAAPPVAPTAITHKSIQELLAEEGVDINDMPLMGTSEPKAAEPVVAEPVVPKATVEPAPIVEDVAPVKAAPEPKPLPELAPAEPAAPAKPRSFLGRLIGS